MLQVKLEGAAEEVLKTGVLPSQNGCDATFTTSHVKTSFMDFGEAGWCSIHPVLSNTLTCLIMVALGVLIVPLSGVEYLTVSLSCECSGGMKSFLCNHAGSCMAPEGHCPHGTCHS